MSGGPVRIDPVAVPGVIRPRRVQVFRGWLYDRRGWPSFLPVWVGRCWYGESRRCVGAYVRVGDRIGGIVFGVPSLTPQIPRKPPAAGPDSTPTR